MVRHDDLELSSRTQVIQAALILYILSKNEIVRIGFDVMKMITEFFAGAADDIEPYDFLNVINSIVNDDFKLQYLIKRTFSNN